MIVFDTGALVALERDDRAMWLRLRESIKADVPVLVPVGALAQAWRSGPRQARLARAIADLEPASFDDLALSAGELCGKAGTADVIDASVALTAAQSGVTHLYTSDPEDLGRLLQAAGRKRRKPQIIPC
ncbi:MAG TPA: PIN domain nuclease [Acidimicrobiia bacterium]|nr:PIN domain nuclease [Acidimicrobiia bacterium]